LVAEEGLARANRGRRFEGSSDLVLPCSNLPDDHVFFTDQFLWEDCMKLIAAAFAALFLAVLGLSVPAPIFTTEASANRMDGRATCGQMVCMQDRYYAAKRKTTKTKKTQ
jgi:hypothetical protein